MKTHSPMVLAAIALVASAGTLAAAPDGDQPLRLKKENHARMIERFDKDGDGRLNDAERAAAKEAMLAERPAMAERRADKMKRFDKDGDGKLSDAEKAEARAAGKHRVERMREGALKRFDKDGDGRLSDAEKSEARAMAHARGAGKFREQMIRRFDKDGDGTLNDAERAEAKSAWENFLSQRPTI